MQHFLPLLQSFLNSQARWTDSDRRLAQRIRDAMLQASPVVRLTADPTLLFTQADMTPDPWQTDLLRHHHDRLLLCCSRQAGKSQTAAAIALKTAFLEPASLILVLSRTDRQAGELFKAKLKPLLTHWRHAFPIQRETERELILANGSRIVCLPGKGDTIVGYSGVRLILIDEAARVPDDFYRVVRPMLARRQGRLMALSTPYGKRGWFYKAWEEEDGWHKVMVKAEQCPSISPKFLAEERQALGDRWYRQEYECSFEETVDAVFSSADIAAMFNDTDVQPLSRT
jgi:hypothetical protein